MKRPNCIMLCFHEIQQQMGVLVDLCWGKSEIMAIILQVTRRLSLGTFSLQTMESITIQHNTLLRETVIRAKCNLRAQVALVLVCIRHWVCTVSLLT